MWLVIGLACFVVTIVVIRDVRQLDAYTYTIGLAGLILLLLPVVPGVGTEVNGAKLWVNLGFITFQPAEAGRILIVIFLASYLSQRREMLAAGVGRLGLPRPKDLGPLLLAWGASLAVLFLERDMGASLLLFGVFVVMVWVATGRWSYLILGLVLFAIGAFVGYLAFSHVQVRVDAWLHAMDPKKVADQGYQLAQGWFALASGGMVGTGLGQGSPTLIPYVGSDFILAAFGEELGMLGVAAAAAALPRAGRARAADRGRAHRRVREAARGRAHDAARPAGVRDRRRGAATDPAHRRAAAARSATAVPAASRPRSCWRCSCARRPARGSARRRAPAPAKDACLMDRQIRRLGIAFVALFAVLFAQVAYVQVVAADRIANEPANAARQIRAEYAGGAWPDPRVGPPDRARRVASPTRTRTRRIDSSGIYPKGELYGQLTGYYSQIYGRSGLEQAMNPYLAGTAPEFTTQNLTDIILGRPRRGRHRADDPRAARAGRGP